MEHVTPWKPRNLAKIKTVCCECGDVIKEGPTKSGLVSHGYCARCAAVIMRFVERAETWKNSGKK